MGYSCTKAADDTLKLIGTTFATDGNPNVLTIGGRQYFFERGREQADGAVTGSLMLMLADSMCQKVGTVRINPDGTIARFPRIPANVRTQLSLKATVRERMPAYDVTGNIMAYEQGELDQDEQVVLFQHLIDTGLAWTLQGHYGRTAVALIEAGVCKPKGGN